MKSTKLCEKIKSVSFGKLALACLFVLMLNLDSSLQANTNPLTDKSKHIYHPQTRDELVELLRDEKIKLDTIDTSKITDMSFLFANVPVDMCYKWAKDNKSFEPYIQKCKNNAGMRKNLSGIETWDVSNVTDMTFMFAFAIFFNRPLNSWDVGNVTNMKSMFAYAKSFNRPLDKWNVGKVENMSYMFSGAESFNQPLDSWNVSNVENIAGMFWNAKSFNQPLNSWNVSNVTDMAGIFTGAESFNQPLESWNVSNVINMSHMFSGTKSFNQALNSWDV